MQSQKLTPEQIGKRRAQQQAMQERAREKQRAKQADPEWRASQQAKQRAAQDRYRAKAIDKQREQFRTATIAQQDAIDDYSNETRPALVVEPRLMALADIKPKPPKQPQRRPSTRGLKGRTPLKFESEIADQLAKLPCIACHVHGKYSPVISLHHMHGRTVLGAHEKQLPLCDWHHQGLAPAEVRRQYPWLIPFHAAGKHGGKADWQRLNGTQEELHEKCLVMIADGGFCHP